jgi:hypothetical protein
MIANHMCWLIHFKRNAGMATPQFEEDAELAAMKDIFERLNDLEADARTRVINYVLARLDIATNWASARRRPAADAGDDEHDENDNELERKQANAPKFSTFAELFNAARPETHAHMALVAGYWLQVCQGAEYFNSFSANAELKHQGHRVDNITAAINALRAQKPALVIQLRKSGKSRQARKTYKVTPAGIQAVEEMIKNG